MGERERERRDDRFRRPRCFGAPCNLAFKMMDSGGGTSTVECRGCRTLLRYPATGAESHVACVICGTVTDLRPLSRLICGGCRTMLEYPSGAQSVMCTVCESVNSTTQRQLTGE